MEQEDATGLLLASSRDGAAPRVVGLSGWCPRMLCEESSPGEDAGGRGLGGLLRGHGFELWARETLSNRRYLAAPYEMRKIRTFPWRGKVFLSLHPFSRLPAWIRYAHSGLAALIVLSSRIYMTTFVELKSNTHAPFVQQHGLSPSSSTSSFPVPEQRSFLASILLLPSWRTANPSVATE